MQGEAGETVVDFRDDIYFMALTVKMEAESEPWPGKLAVAYVSVNRGGSVIDRLLQGWQFSAWNTDSPTRMNIDTMAESVFRECYKAAAGAYFGLVGDPGEGATHYLNEALTRKLRGGDLPGWFDEKKVTARIGKHTFLKL